MKNVSQVVTYYAWDTSANTYKTGDSANHTLRGMQDTTEFTPAASPSEIDSTNLKGAYKVSIAATENIGALMLVGGVSSTANIVILPVRWSNDAIAGVVRSGVAAGGGGSTITLDANASATNSIYNGCRVAIVAGTGIGQGDRIITGYVGSTQVATVDTAWTTNPDNSSVFVLIPAAADLRTVLLTLSKGAAGSVAPDWGQVQNPTTVVGLAGTTIATSQVVASVSGAVGSVTGNVGGNVIGTVASVTAAVSLTIAESGIVQSGTAAAGAATAITIATALGADNICNGQFIKITGGTGIGQTRLIIGYVNSTKVVTVDYAWTTNPDNTSTYAIMHANLPTITAGLKITEVSLVDTLTTYTGNTPQTGDVFGQLPSHFSALSISAAGKINEVVLVDTLTTYTGDTPQTGDSFAQLPTNFHVLSISGAGKINEVVLVDTLTAYAGNTPQTGDVFAKLPTNFNALAITAGGAVSLAAGQLFVKKNTQLTSFMFVMTDSTLHNPVTGLTVTATRSIDGGAFGACANAVTEVSNGWYKITLAATDLNGTVVALRFTAAASDDKDLTIITQA